MLWEALLEEEGLALGAYIYKQKEPKSCWPQRPELRTNENHCRPELKMHWRPYPFLQGDASPWHTLPRAQFPRCKLFLGIRSGLLWHKPGLTNPLLLLKMLYFTLKVIGQLLFPAEQTNWGEKQTRRYKWSPLCTQNCIFIKISVFPSDHGSREIPVNQRPSSSACNFSSTSALHIFPHLLYTVALPAHGHSLLSGRGNVPALRYEAWHRCLLLQRFSPVW